MTRRIVVAYQEIESPQARLWRHMAGGVVTKDDLRGRRKGLGRYWCAADKPGEDDGFHLAPVYRTHDVPEGAECQHCRIGIRELQIALGPTSR